MAQQSPDDARAVTVVDSKRFRFPVGMDLRLRRPADSAQVTRGRAHRRICVGCQSDFGELCAPTLFFGEIVPNLAPAFTAMSDGAAPFVLGDAEFRARLDLGAVPTMFDQRIAALTQGSTGAV